MAGLGASSSPASQAVKGDTTHPWGGHGGGLGPMLSQMARQSCRYQTSLSGHQADKLSTGLTLGKELTADAGAI